MTLAKTPNEQAYTLIIGELHIDLDEANKTIADSIAERDKLQRRINTLEICGAADRNTAAANERRLYRACAVIREAAEALTTIPSGEAFYQRVEDVLELLKQDI